jgi:hypothetical protein
MLTQLMLMKRCVAAGLVSAGLLMSVAEPVVGQVRLAQAEESSTVGEIEPFTVEGTLDANSEVLEDDGIITIPIPLKDRRVRMSPLNLQAMNLTPT